MNGKCNVSFVASQPRSIPSQSNVDSIETTCIQQIESFQSPQIQINNALSIPTSPCQLELSVSESCTENHPSTLDTTTTTTTRLPGYHHIITYQADLLPELSSQELI